jgi:REP element-mobilizing transposase RayT
MQQSNQLEYDNYYHIYNHGVGNRDLFLEADNYEYFLSQWDKYISPVADMYAWVLMKNHFHVLVRIKKESEIVAAFTPDRVSTPVRGNVLSLQFSKLFNSYAQAFNKRNNSHGALFERPFNRKHIDNDYYLRQVILYIHNNPVHHGFCSHPVEYPWCSYLTCVSIKPTKLHREAVIGWFDSEANFRSMHKGDIDKDSIEGWLEMY